MPGSRPLVHDLPDIEPLERFSPLGPLQRARGHDPGGAPARVPPGPALAQLLEAAPDAQRDLVASGVPTGVSTGDLVTAPYPTSFGLWRAARSPAPLLWLTTRMLVVQWADADGTTRTLLWGPSDHERSRHTAYYARLRARTPLPDRTLEVVHGTVLGHVRALGIDPEDVDYLAFDHLHAQDVRRLLGTRGPAADLGSPQTPLEGWFPNARLLVPRLEWESIRHLHPMQAPWYQPEAFVDLPPERLASLEGDVVLGPGVALIATPGHTIGSMSLALSTDDGVWVCSHNGVAAESWAPRASRIPGVRSWAVEWGQEVILNAGTPTFAAWQYDSMMVERQLADPCPDVPFPQCFPMSELTPHRLAPGLGPTHQHVSVSHGRIRGSSVARIA